MHTNSATEGYFLPGTMCDQRLWQAVWEKLPSTTPPHFISLAEGNSFEEMEKLIFASLPEYPVHLVGFSMGGYVALQFALKYPEKLKSLVLMASSARGLKNNELRMRENTLKYLKSVPYNGIAMARIRQLLHPNYVESEAIVQTIKDMDQDLGKEVLISQLTATSKRVSLLDELNKLDLPVLLVGGDHDQIVPQADLTAMYNEFEDARLEIIANCGHMLPLEKPTQIAQLLNEWFSFHH